jgi:hypothetical protein
MPVTSAAGMTAPAHGLVLWKIFYKSKLGQGVLTDRSHSTIGVEELE